MSSYYLQITFREIKKPRDMRVKMKKKKILLHLIISFVYSIIETRKYV